MILEEGLCMAIIESVIQLEWRPPIALGSEFLLQSSDQQFGPPQKLQRNLKPYLKGVGLLIKLHFYSYFS